MHEWCRILVTTAVVFIGALASDLRLSFAAGDERQDRPIEQILKLAPAERNQALAALRDRPDGLFEGPAAQSSPMLPRVVSGCSSFADSDGAIAVSAAAKASSGAEFLQAEADATDMVAKAKARLQAVDAEAPQAEDPLAAELFRRVDRDQAARHLFEPEPPGAGKPASPLARYIFSFDLAAMTCGIDHDNTGWLKDQLAAIGWFDLRKYGRRADQAAWLLVQHADRDPDFQESTLEILRRLAEEGGTSRTNYAYLHDRVAVNHGRPQLYGTQGLCQDGTWQPRPVERQDDLDQRRTAIGLAREEDYRKLFSCAD
jgi:hypothetical protein